MPSSTQRRRAKARHRRPQWRKRIVRWAAVLGVSALMSGGALAAVSLPGDSSVASGTFLSGSLLSSIPLDDVVGLGGASATNLGDPTPVTDTASLDLSALNALEISLPGGLDLPFGQFIQLGAVNQYAQASDAGVSRSASGAVSNNGAVSLHGSDDFPADATVDLTRLLGSAADEVLSAAKLHVGAVSGVAALDAVQGAPAETCADLSNPVECRDYNVADAGLNLESPLVGQLVSSVNGTLDTASDTVNALSTAINNSIFNTVANALSALSGGTNKVSVTINADLRGALSTVLSESLSQGGVTLDLENGTITVDLAALVGSLSDQAPNTPLISADVIDQVVEDLNLILGQLQTNINNALATALDSVGVTISGGICAITGCDAPLGGELGLSWTGTLGVLATGHATIGVTGTGAVFSILAPVLGSLTGQLSTTLGDIVTPVRSTVISTVGNAVTNAVTTLTTALDPVLQEISTVIGATLNVQEPGTASGSYREVAVRLSLLSGLGATIDLGRAEVGANAVVAASIASIDPNHGPQTGGTTVTITGNGFTDATGVTFDGAPGTGFAVVDDSHITVITPAHDPGTANVVVDSPRGNSAPGSFTFDAVPVASSIDPATGPESGGTVVTINGTGFSDATSVAFDGVAGTQIDVVSDTQILITTPPHAAGAVDVVVHTPTGDSAPLEFTYTPVTTIDGVDPASGPAAGGTTVTITGHCFTGASAVEFGTTAATDYEVVSDTQITATAPSGTGVVDVTVIGSTACGTGVDPGAYTYLAPPTVSSLTPVQGPTAGGTVVTITGTGFTGATGVTFDGSSGTTFSVDSDTQITVTTPAHAAGAVDVVVQSPDGDSAPGDFTYTPVTTISDVTPNQGPQAGDTNVVITGQCFVGATAVLFGSTPATSFTVDSATQITAVAPAGTGTVDVTVVGAGACGTGTDPSGYTYVPTPSVTSLDPNHGPQTGGTTVTIEGTGFGTATGVTFDGVPGTDFTRVNDTEITVVTPEHAPGAVAVVVTDPLRDSEQQSYTFDPVAQVTSVAPNFGPVAGGTSVVITGQCFTHATAVLFGDTSTTDFTIDSDTQITVVSPPGTGVVGVEVETADCGTASLPGAFTYVAPDAPVITSLDPVHGPQTGGTTVTIIGTGFTGATGVTFGGVPGTGVVVDSDTQITVTTPAHDPGSAVVTIGSPRGPSAPGTFIFDPVTQIDDVTPGSGPEAGGSSVTISGQCFTGASAVLFGDTPATSFSVTDDSEIVAVVPAGVGTVSVTVVGGGNCGSGTDPGAFTYTPAPVIQSLTPNHGPTAGGTTVVITGTGFDGATAVTFGTAAASFTINSDTRITAISPAHDAGAVAVTVTGPGGTSGSGAFTFVPSASIDTIDPSTGPETGGTSVTITGSGFTNATGVTFGGEGGGSFTVNGDTSITVTTPPHTPGDVDVVVLSPDGDSTPGTFAYTPVTTITGVSPSAGPEDGGTQVTITGRCFAEATGVEFGGVPADSFTVVSDTEITAVTPAGTGKVDVTVIGAGDCGTSALPGGFSYVTSAQALALAATGMQMQALGSGILTALGIIAAGIVLLVMRRRRAE